MPVRYYIRKLKARFELVEPGVNPLESGEAENTPRRSSKSVWLPFFAIFFMSMCCWGTWRAKNATAQVEQPATPSATQTATEFPTSTPTLTATSTRTATPTMTPTIQASDDISATLAALMPWALHPTGVVEVTRIVEKSISVPGPEKIVYQTVVVPEKVEVIVPVAITSTPGPTQTPWIIEITSTPGPTQTPWIIIVTATPQPTPDKLPITPGIVNPPSATPTITATLTITPTLPLPFPATFTPTPNPYP